MITCHAITVILVVRTHAFNMKKLLNDLVQTNIYNTIDLVVLDSSGSNFSPILEKVSSQIFIRNIQVHEVDIVTRMDEFIQNARHEIVILMLDVDFFNIKTLKQGFSLLENETVGSVGIINNDQDNISIVEECNIDCMWGAPAGLKTKSDITNSSSTNNVVYDNILLPKKYILSTPIIICKRKLLLALGGLSNNLEHHQIGEDLCLRMQNELHKENKYIIASNNKQLNQGYSIQATVKKSKENHEEVSIIIPIYNALSDVKNCLHSVIKCRDDTFNIKIILVNDCSNTDTSDWLKEFSNSHEYVTLVNNRCNLGYTKSINKGISVSNSEFVVLLNSDTEVTTNWISGLFQCITSDEKIGIVGPLSNAASWQSIPFVKNKEQTDFIINSLPYNISANIIAKMLNQISHKDYPRFSIINGFCMMIRREVFNKIGLFDEINFPLGYGEENDFCIRAHNSGYTLAIADNVYVYHAKSKSFGKSTRTELVKSGSDALKKKHGHNKYINIVTKLEQESRQLDGIRRNILSRVNAYKKSNTHSTLSYDLAGSPVLLKPKPVYMKKGFDITENISGPAITLEYDGPSCIQHGDTLLSIGVHLHLYHIDMIEEFIVWLSNIQNSYNLYISVVRDEIVSFVQSIFTSRLSNANVHVSCFPNRGRDIAPFIAGFSDDLLQNDLICHIHTKKSIHNFEKADWRRQLLTSLLGSKRIVSNILELFKRNPHLGMLFPEYHHSLKNQISWGTNFSLCQKLSNLLDFKICEKEMVLFPAGSMFWVRRDAIIDLLSKGFAFSAFEPEANQIDGTLAHAFERLFGEIVYKNNYDILQVKSRKPHNLVHYYSNSWPYTIEKDINNLDSQRKRYCKLKTDAKKDVVVYSAISGDYDRPVLHEYLDCEIDYYLFSDTIRNPPFPWKPMEMPYISHRRVLNARFIKTHPHKYFKDYSLAIWIDANIIIKQSLIPFIDLARSHPNSLVFGIPHPVRKCIYQESKAVILSKKAKEEIVSKQIQRYKISNYPHNYGLIETNFIMFNLSSPIIHRVLDDWWHEIENYSHRDQLSLNYILWKYSVPWIPIFSEKFSTRDSSCFATLGHGSNSGYSLHKIITRTDE